MPTLVSEVDVCLERADLLRRAVLPRSTGPDGMIVPPVRSPGLHLSGLLRYIARRSKITAYIQDADEEDAIERGHLPLRWFLGQIVEEGLASLYPATIWQPGEAREPVIMTPDGISDATGACMLTVEEFKCRRTKKITGEKLLARWIFMQQGMGYCLGYGAEYVRWHILALLEWPDPVLTQYLVQFSERELDESRRMIEGNKRAAIEAGYSEQ